MGTVLDIRADEMARLRARNRRLREQLNEIESILHDNAEMVDAMHRLSILLIAREKDWITRAESILRRGLGANAAEIHVVRATNKTLSAQIARLPVAGRADDAPLRANVGKGALYYHLPIKEGRRVKGLLTLSFRRKTALRSGDDELCRRIGAMLSAAL